MRVLVIGTGAVGSFYGALLAKVGAEVSVVARSDYETVRDHGILIRSDAGLGDIHFRPAAVLRRAEDLADPPDYVLLCVKIVPGADRVGLLRGALGPETRIVLICNGVEIEAEIAAAFPGRELISGLAFIGVSRSAPGQIHHEAYGRLSLGVYPGGVSTAVTRLCEAFKAAGIGCSATEDIVTARWQKCVWNAAFNPLSVLAGGLDTAALLDTGEALVRAVMEDVCRLAAALGHALPADIVDKQVAGTRAMGAYKTSMLLDFEAGRPMETEAILGNAVRAAARVGVQATYLETLYGLLKLRDQSPAGG